MLKWVALFCNSFFVLCLALSTTATIAMLPAIQNELQLSPILARWLLSGNIGMGAIVILWVGALGDRWGSFRVLAYGLFGFSLASAWITWSQDGMSTVMARTLQGVAGATISAQALASIQIVFPGPERARAMAIWGAFVSIGFGMGAWVAGVVSYWLSWRYLFGALTLIGAGGGVLNLVFFTMLRQAKKISTLDWWSFLFFVGTIVPIVLWLLTGPFFGWISWVSIVYLLCAVVFCLLFLRRASEGPDAERYRVLVRHHYFRLGLILFFVVLFSLIGFFYFYNRFAQSPWGYALNSLQSGKSLFPTNFAMMLMMSVVPWLGRDNRRIEYLMCLGYGCTALGMFIFAALTLCPLSSLQYLPQILIGSGFGLTFSTVPFLALQSLPQEVHGRASGLLNTVNYLGGCSAVALGSLIFLLGGSLQAEMEMGKLDQAFFGCQGLIGQYGGQFLGCNLPRAFCYGFRLFLMTCGVLAAGSGFLVWNNRSKCL